MKNDYFRVDSVVSYIDSSGEVIYLARLDADKCHPPNKPCGNACFPPGKKCGVGEKVKQIAKRTAVAAVNPTKNQKIGLGVAGLGLAGVSLAGGIAMKKKNGKTNHPSSSSSKPSSSKTVPEGYYNDLDYSNPGDIDEHNRRASEENREIMRAARRK